MVGEESQTIVKRGSCHHGQSVLRPPQDKEKKRTKYLTIHKPLKNLEIVLRSYSDNSTKTVNHIRILRDKLTWNWQHNIGVNISSYGVMLN